MMTIEEIKQRAHAVGEEIKKAGTVQKDLRKRFIEVRSALYQRGIYDPVLVRFDSATAPSASAAEIAAQLESIASSLRV